MKIALVQDQLREFGGAERVLVSLKKIFPDSDVFTSTYCANTLGVFKKEVKTWKINVSWFGRIPLINRLYSPLRFITPWVWESFDFSKYDLVISSSGSWMSKGIITKKPTIHISYIHHPPRYLYGYETAIEWQKYPIVKIYGLIINHFLRIWDFNSSKRADYYIANSEETKRRIYKFYRRDSTVIYPPVNVPKKLENVRNNPLKYYITVSRLAKAKHIDVLIKTFNQLGYILKIVGTGRDEKYLKSIAKSNVKFLGNITDQQLSEEYSKAAAFLFASVDEEFGIAPVESMGYGLPVIAYKSGGIPETVKENYNGFLYDQLTPESIINKIKLFEKLSIKQKTILRQNARLTAQKFTETAFKKNILNFIRSKTKFDL